jgi:hypothetical protein
VLDEHEVDHVALALTIFYKELNFKEEKRSQDHHSEPSKSHLSKDLLFSPASTCNLSAGVTPILWPFPHHSTG